MDFVGSGDSAALYLFSLVWITTLLTFCQGTGYDHPAQYMYPFIKPASSFAPPPSSAASRSQSEGGSSYDYIIVGGGTAGCPLAATLSQNYTVLLLERGGTPFANVNVSFVQNFHLTLADLSATSASQMFISTDGVFNSRARVLGGGSSVNAGFYTRASTRPGANGVIFKDENGMIHRAVLSKRYRSEVIVSSGAIGSPQLLLLSGIGPKQDLEKLNIPVVLDNEFVGKGMSDNPLNTIFVPLNHPVKQSLIQTVGITKFGVYIEASSGFSQSRDSIRCDNCDHGITSAEIGQLSTIPPKQRTHEAINEYRRRKRNLPHEAFMGGFILAKIAKPRSKGEISLKNTNIDDNPSITFNYFSHPQDLAKCVNGIRVVEKLINSKHFSNYTQLDEKTLKKLINMSVTANVNMIPRHTNDTKSLEQFCKDTVITIWHYHGGCHVGKVVHHDHKVVGVERLRVIDGSTFENSPGTNPQATVMMMGRYMGVKILRERLGKAAGV